ncbi:MAG: nucleotide exchange factor GrpE [Bacteroidales bacterium]|nr:nucleotide exchange factor GrpE [Bacteroidales bacterium]MBO5847395.1 nucleotide exchange factor GrpE [Bacteroidales bacterium]MBO5916811.1 nucleotide exchange factor GrpE [Bacteroidales bacterium]MBO5977992.1 nucleotide exchange factor GrpE [Bacteroidales bacterium]MBO7232912.1 nucleotide exchange factor GrpE [Bacteroidales bacterium]
MNKTKKEGQQAANENTEEILDNKNQETQNQEVQNESEAKESLSELDELKAKYEQLNDTYLRSRAEFENYRKRTLAEKAELIKNGGEKVLTNILGVIDDFERGLNALETAENIEAVKEGMTLVYNKLQSFLKQNGVAAIDTKDQVFDTDLHEAITMIPAPDESMKGKVVDCVQKGYFLNDKVIRFAKVVVAN